MSKRGMEFYEDHITSIVRRAEQEGRFDELKGKKLVLDGDLSYNPDKQFNNVLRNNHVLPKWIELGKEIDQLKEELKGYENKYNIKRTIEAINKKVINYNLICPPTAQKSGIRFDDYMK